MLCMYMHVPTAVTTPYLEIALDGVIDGGCVHVVLWHEDIDHNVSDGRLEIRLFSIHQQTHAFLLCKVSKSPCPLDHSVHLLALLMTQHCRQGGLQWNTWDSYTGYVDREDCSGAHGTNTLAMSTGRTAVEHMGQIHWLCRQGGLQWNTWDKYTGYVDREDCSGAHGTVTLAMSTGRTAVEHMGQLHWLC